jgi:putative toxin-antitoxin system antitoxin component (TIGR02293 family)
MATHASVRTSAAEKRPAPPDVDRFRRALEKGGETGNDYALLLGLRKLESRGLVKLVEKGLPFSALVRLQRNVDIPLRELADLARIPPRTLDRRRARGRLEPEESDRVVRLSRVFGAALRLFEGEEEAARAWLRRRHPALGGERPLDLVRTEVGAREVERLIGRLEHGVFS